MLGWHQFLDDNISEYKKVYTDWIRSRLPKTIICFEKMEKDPIGTMTTLVSDQNWFNADHVRFRDNCTAGNINGAFKRKHNFDYSGIFKVILKNLICFIPHDLNSTSFSGPRTRGERIDQAFISLAQVK